MRGMGMSAEKKQGAIQKKLFQCDLRKQVCIGCCHTSADAFCIEDCKKALSGMALLAGNMPLAQQHCLNLKNHLLRSNIVCMLSVVNVEA